MINSFLKSAEGRRIGFFGIGRSNTALINLLPGSGAEIILRSDGKIDRAVFSGRVKISKAYEGRDAARDIREDFLIFSPSVRRDRQEFLSALGRGCVFSSDFELFLKYNQKPIFLVTGSDGKTTTTTLISRILGFPAIGNIGEPMTPRLDDEAEGFAVEASSFMLEYARPKSRRAALTSLTENHLNWHYTLADYKRAKLMAIYGADEAVISSDSPLISEVDLPKSVFAVCGIERGTERMASSLRAEICCTVDEGYITKNGRRLIHRSELLRGEEYNVKNYLTALSMTAGFADEDDAISAIKGFGGIPHRGERLGKISGIEFINSSIDTTPARTEATLRDMPEGIIILMGGRDKGLDFSTLSALLKKRGDRVIAFGEAEEKILSAMGEISIPTGGGLSEAISRAAEIARQNDTVILSPAATSYDEFQNVEDRGHRFKELVLQLF